MGQTTAPDRDVLHGGDVGHRADLRGHPVADLVDARIAERSQPGARADEHVLALAVEGGGMRGVVSAGMVAALGALGAGRAFDLVLGVSAGASNAFAFVAGSAHDVVRSYVEQCTDGDFLDLRRALWRRGPVMDLQHLVDAIVVGPYAEEVPGALAGGIRLGFVATDARTGAPAVLEGFTGDAEVRAGLRASSVIPGIAGPPVTFRGHDYVDGSISESIPYAAAARAGATHVLVLQTRPVGVPLRPPSRPERLLVARALRHLPDSVKTAYRGRPERYARAVAELAERSADEAGPPYLATVRPAAGTPPVGHLEQDHATLRAGARSGAAAVHTALRGRHPWLDGNLRATV